MKFPVALIAAVLVWSSARYLPPYFLELRRMDIAEQKLQLEAARNLAVIKELRSHMQSRAKPTGDTGDGTLGDKRFY